MEVCEVSEQPKLRLKKCIICSGFQQEAVSLLANHANENGLLAKFCEKFLLPSSLQQSQQSEELLWRGRSVCSNCSGNVSRVLDTKAKMEEVEGRVRKLQLEVVLEMRELQIYLDLLGSQLGRIERSCVIKKEADEDPGSRNESDKNGGRFRKCIANVVEDLNRFRNRVEQKVDCGDGRRYNVQAQVARKRPFNTNHQIEEKRNRYDDDDPIIHDDNDDHYDDVDGGMISDNESDRGTSSSIVTAHPSFQSHQSSSLVSVPGGSDKGDIEEISRATRSSKRTLLIKRIKLEPSASVESQPGSDSEDENGNEDCENNDGAVAQLPSRSDYHSPTLQLLLKEQRAFQQKALANQELIKQSQLELKNKLLQSLSAARPLSLEDIPGQGSLFSLLPVKSVEDLDRLEELLLEQQNQERLVEAFCRFGRPKISKTTGDILSYLLEVRFSLEVRYTNTSGKIPLGEKRICECVRVAVHRNHPDFKMNEINGKIGAWLRGSIDRGGGRRERNSIPTSSNSNSIANAEEDEESSGDEG